MPEYFQKPENALKKAQEFLEVGKKQDAVVILSDLLRSKKHRTYQKVHDSIIYKHLELCVDLRKSQQAKEGLYQYKNITQQVNPKSLEDATLYYLDLAETKTKEAREKSQETALKMVEDLDMIDTPEGMLLKAVTGEQTQDRTDRLLLTPWVKYLWESYRQVLDLLRNNSRVEKLYHMVARKAFAFCNQYDRRTEFRKLCDNLRNHVKLSEQRHGAQFSVNLSNPETQSFHLETKICQLDAAVQIELWQEAFKAVEDIHYLMSLSKRPPKPQTLANFHIKLALVFKKADFMLFHACARHSLFRLTRDMKKNPTRDDLTRMASLLLVSTLAIPITGQKHGIGKILDMEQTLIDKLITLSKLLGLDRPPTRKGLLEDFIRLNLLDYVPRQLKDLYKWLEIDFHPLHLTEKVSTALTWIQEQTKEPELVQYIEPLQEVVVCRVLQQVATSYESIKMDRLLKLLPFCDEFTLEQIIVDAARNGQLQARIDHNKRCIYLGTDLNASPLYVEDEFFENQRLQALPSERVSESFNEMAKSLMAAHYITNKEEILKESRKVSESLVAHYHKHKVRDHAKILKRKQIIEQRKEEMETLNQEKERKEQRLVQEQEEAVKEAEKARLNKEQQEREARRKEELEKEEKRRSANDRLEIFKKSEIGLKMLKDIDIETLEKINPEELMKKQVETLEKEKKEMHDRLRAQEKKIDYFERAKRLSEIPLYQKRAEEERIENEKLWNEIEEAKVQNIRKEHSTNLEHKARLSRMLADKNAFIHEIMEREQAAYEEKMKAFNARLKQAREERLAKRRHDRKIQRFAQKKREREEEARRVKEEEERIRREEEERKQREAQEKRMREQEEQREKQREQERRQRERELEMERKLEERNQSSFKREEPSWRSSQDRPSADGDRWRRRDQAPSSNSAYRPPQRSNESSAYRPPQRSNESSAYRPPQQRSSGFQRDSFNDRRNDDSRFGRLRDDPPRSGRFDNAPRSRFGDDQGPRGYRDDDRRRDGPPSDNRSWRRQAAAPSPRRKSPAGISPSRRSSPPGRSDSPHQQRGPRRGSPAGGRSPVPPTQRNWRQESSAPSSGSWRGRDSAAAPSTGDGKYRPPQASDRPYVPRARQQAAAAERSDSKGRLPSNNKNNNKEEGDEWTTVETRRR